MYPPDPKSTIGSPLGSELFPSPDGENGVCVNRQTSSSSLFGEFFTDQEQKQSPCQSLPPEKRTESDSGAELLRRPEADDTANSDQGRCINITFEEGEGNWKTYTCEDVNCKPWSVDNANHSQVRGRHVRNAHKGCLLAKRTPGRKKTEKEEKPIESPMGVVRRRGSTGCIQSKPTTHARRKSTACDSSLPCDEPSQQDVLSAGAENSADPFGVVGPDVCAVVGGVFSPVEGGAETDHPQPHSELGSEQGLLRNEAHCPASGFIVASAVEAAISIAKEANAVASEARSIAMAAASSTPPGVVYRIPTPEAVAKVVAAAAAAALAAAEAWSIASAAAAAAVTTSNAAI